MKSKIIITCVNRSLIGMLALILILQSCIKSDVEDERQKTIRLLASDGSKSWVIEQSYVDDSDIILSSCDSAYVLTMNSDFTWKEEYLHALCYASGYGNWALNEENNVLSIQFIDPRSGSIIEKKFEIVKLSEQYFAYQFAENNRLKYVRMRAEWSR